MMREVAIDQDIPIAVFVYKNIGPAVVHNYLCAVCRENKAVLYLYDVLQPCWACHKKYRLIRLTWFDRLIGRAR